MVPPAAQESAAFARAKWTEDLQTSEKFSQRSKATHPLGTDHPNFAQAVANLREAMTAKVQDAVRPEMQYQCAA